MDDLNRYARNEIELASRVETVRHQHGFGIE